MKLLVRAFTLVELLVVVALIGVLAALLLPQLGRAGERARANACRSNLRQIGLGLRLYLDDHQNRFPTLQNRSAGTNLVLTVAMGLTGLGLGLLFFPWGGLFAFVPGELFSVFPAVGPIG